MGRRTDDTKNIALQTKLNQIQNSIEYDRLTGRRGEPK